MASTKNETVSQNTLQRTLEQEKLKQASKYEINKVLFTWEADDRPTYQFTPQQKTYFTGLVVLIGLYFFWIGQPMLSLVTGALLFIMYIVMSIPPQRMKHTVETAGVRSFDYLYVWEDMTDFWFAERNGKLMLYIDTRLNFPSRLIFIVDSFQEATKIVELLVKRVEYKLQRGKQTWVERMIDGDYVDPTVFFGEEQVAQAEEQAAKQEQA